MQKITITQFDYDRLTQLLSKKKPLDEYEQAIEAELEKADIVQPGDIPTTSITMNSHVRFKDETGKMREYWLVFPEDADIMEGKLSILSPVGCALLGYSVGDTVEFPMPSGATKRLVVEEIMFQPEREGKFDQ